jgi:hypothetical protein
MDSQYDDQYLLLAKNLNRLLIEYPEGFATDLSIDGQTLKSICKLRIIEFDFGM